MFDTRTASSTGQNEKNLLDKQFSNPAQTGKPNPSPPADKDKPVLDSIFVPTAPSDPKPANPAELPIPVAPPQPEPPQAAKPAPRPIEIDPAAPTPLFRPDAYRIIWQGSPNFWSGRDGQTPVAICNHIMDGTIESSNAWFKNRRSEASSHFGIARDGRIWQWVRVQDSAWTNGILQNPDLSVGWLADSVRRNINPNTRTVSIEHEGYTGRPFTEEQYKASLWLHRYLCTRYNIVPDREHVIGHYQVTARDRAHCPGPAFPWKRLMTDLAAGVAVLPGRSGPASLNKFIDGVQGIVFGEFGPATVSTNNSYIRTKPSLSGQDGTLLQMVPKGKLLHFSGYADSGPAFRGNPRWYLISEADGGGWIHAIMVN